MTLPLRAALSLTLLCAVAGAACRDKPAPRAAPEPERVAPAAVAAPADPALSARKKARALVDQGDLLGAIEVLDGAALGLDGQALHDVRCEQALLLNNRSVERMKAGDDRTALADSARAIALCDSDENLKKNRARMLLQLALTDPEPARKRARLEESLALEESASSLGALAELQYADNDLESAVKNLERALQLEPGSPYVQQRLSEWKKQADVEGGFKSARHNHFVARFEGYAEERLAWTTLDLLERAYFSVGRALNVFPRDPITVVIYTGDQYSRATGTPDWSAGAYDGKIRVREGDVQNQNGQLEDLLTHEYVHAALRTGVKGNIPAWFHEGLAQHLEGRSKADQRRLVDDARERGALLPFAALQSTFTAIKEPEVARLAYAQAAMMVDAMTARRGAYSLQQLCAEMNSGHTFEEAFQRVFATAPDHFAR